MIRYKIYQNQQKKGLNAGKWFARAVSDETFDLAKLAEHMSKHNSPYSSGVIKGVLTDMVDCIKELHACLKEIHSQFIFRFIQEHINLVLMNNFLQIRNHKLRDVLVMLRSLRPKYLIDIDQK